MRKIGLMGGTFNPVHNAHLEIAKSAKKQYNLDEVIFMTSGNPPHKWDKDILDAKTRHKMVELAIAGIDCFYASDYEVKKTEYSYSAKTLEWLKEKNPYDKIYFMVGEDSLEYIDKWYHPEIILSLCTILVYPRTNMENLKKTVYDIKEKLGGEIYIIDAPVYDISSTDIRARIRDNMDVSDMLNEKVLDYIIEKGLYK